MTSTEIKIIQKEVLSLNLLFKSILVQASLLKFLKSFDLWTPALWSSSIHITQEYVLTQNTFSVGIIFYRLRYVNPLILVMMISTIISDVNQCTPIELTVEETSPNRYNRQSMIFNGQSLHQYIL